MNYEQYVKSKKIEYKNVSIKKEIDINRFLANYLIVEKLGEDNFINFAHDERKYRKDDYYWFMYNQKILENKIVAEGGYSTLFLTLTLPSTFHKFSKKTKRYNPKYDENCTIENGYELLNDTFRDIYKNFRINRKIAKVYYCKVFEPHKNFTPHLHAILYVKEQYKENLIKHIKNTIVRKELGKSYDIEDVKDLSRSGAYLLKYIRKNTNVNNEETFRIFNGWKKSHKIRVFTCSILGGLERFLYKKIKNNTNITKNLKENPICKILSECNINIETKCLTTKEIKTKTNIVENPKFEILVKKEKTKTKDKKTMKLVVDFVSELRNDFWTKDKKDNFLVEEKNFDKVAYKYFSSNKNLFDVAMEYHIFNFYKFNFRTFFKDLQKELISNIKNIHTYKVVDIKIFEISNNEFIKKYDKKEFYITNTTKKESKFKRIAFELKDQRKRLNKNIENNCIKS